MMLASAKFLMLLVQTEVLVGAEPSVEREAFDCSMSGEASSRPQWSQEQKTWCCERRNTGCQDSHHVASGNATVRNPVLRALRGNMTSSPTEDASGQEQASLSQVRRLQVCQPNLQVGTNYVGNDESQHSGVVTVEACSALCAARGVAYFTYGTGAPDAQRCWCKTQLQTPSSVGYVTSGNACQATTATVTTTITTTQVCQLNQQVGTDYVGNDESDHSGVVTVEACSALCAARGVAYFVYGTGTPDAQRCWCKTQLQTPSSVGYVTSGNACQAATATITTTITTTQVTTSTTTTVSVITVSVTSSTTQTATGTSQTATSWTPTSSTGTSWTATITSATNSGTTTETTSTGTSSTATTVTTTTLLTVDVYVAGDYTTVVGSRRALFLSQCSTTLSPGTCVDVVAGRSSSLSRSPGTILIVVQGAPETFVMFYVNGRGLALPSFGTLYQSTTSTMTTTQVTITSSTTSTITSFAVNGDLYLQGDCACRSTNKAQFLAECSTIVFPATCADVTPQPDPIIVQLGGPTPTIFNFAFQRVSQGLTLACCGGTLVQTTTATSSTYTNTTTAVTATATTRSTTSSSTRTTTASIITVSTTVSFTFRSLTNTPFWTNSTTSTSSTSQYTTSSHTTTTSQVYRDTTFVELYSSIVTDKTRFLQECTAALDPAECVDVLPNPFGYTVVRLAGGSIAEVDMAIKRVQPRGLMLNRFGTLRLVTTTTTTSVDRSMDNCSVSGVAPVTCGSLLSGMTAKGCPLDDHDCTVRNDYGCAVLCEYYGDCKSFVVRGSGKGCQLCSSAIANPPTMPDSEVLWFFHAACVDSDPFEVTTTTSTTSTSTTTTTTTTTTATTPQSREEWLCDVYGDCGSSGRRACDAPIRQAIFTALALSIFFAGL